MTLPLAAAAREQICLVGIELRRRRDVTVDVDNHAPNSSLRTKSSLVHGQWRVAGSADAQRATRHERILFGPEADSLGPELDKYAAARTMAVERGQNHHAIFRSHLHRIFVTV